MNPNELKLNQKQTDYIVDDMPCIEDPIYESMSFNKKEIFHNVLAETFLESNFMDRQELINFAIDDLYFKFSHGDMYERGLIEPNLTTDEEKELFEKGNYDEINDMSWEFLHENIIDFANEELSIRTVELDKETVYYKEADAFHEENFTKTLNKALEKFKSQSLAMDLEASLDQKADATRKLKI